MAQVKKSKWFLLRPKKLYMLLDCFLLIKAEKVPKDDNKPFIHFFVNLFLLIHPEFSGGRKRYEMTYFLGCYPIVPHTPTEVWRAPLIHFQKILFKKGLFRSKSSKELKFYAWIIIEGRKSLKKGQKMLKKATNLV